MRAAGRAGERVWYAFSAVQATGPVVEVRTELGEARSPDGEDRRAKLLVATERGATKPAAARASPTTGGIRRRALHRDRVVAQLAAQEGVEQHAVFLGDAREADAVGPRPAVLRQGHAIGAQHPRRAGQLELERDLLLHDVGLEHLVEQHAARRDVDRPADVRLTIDVLVDQQVDGDATLAALGSLWHVRSSVSGPGKTLGPTCRVDVG